MVRRRTMAARAGTLCPYTTLVRSEVGSKALEKHVKIELCGVNLAGPLPPVKESARTSNAIKLAIVHMAQRENLTVRQLYKRVYGYSNHVVIATPKDSA